MSYSFLSFNYTYTLDTLLQFSRIGSVPVHIHGTLNNDVILGVDSIEQLNGCPYPTTRKMQRAFIKPKFNEAYDSERLETARSMILNSDIICSYGFSYGESDETWLELILQWLISDSRHHLVAYQFDDTAYDKFNSDILMDAEDEKKEMLLKKLSAPLLTDDVNILNQVHIPVGYDIFNFDFSKSSKEIAMV